MVIAALDLMIIYPLCCINNLVTRLDPVFKTVVHNTDTCLTWTIDVARGARKMSAQLQKTHQALNLVPLRRCAIIPWAQTFNLLSV